MSDYVYVIEELDFPDETCEINSVKGADVLENQTAEVLINDAKCFQPNATVETTQNNAILSDYDIIIPVVNGIKNDAALKYKSSVLGPQTFDLTKVSENSYASASDIKVWTQYRWDCFLCAHRTGFYHTLTIHLKDCHNITSEDDIRFKCYDCGLIIDEYSQFLNHIRQNHHPHLKLVCDVCSRDYKRYENLAKHRRSAHLNHCLRPKIFNCTECELAFATKEDLGDHAKDHIWSCTPKTPKSYLKTHMSNNKFENPATCGICWQIFPTHEVYLAHLATHPNEAPFNCDKCEARFKMKWEFLSHMEYHKLIRCKHCLHVSSNEQQHKLHLSVHLPPKTNQTWSKCSKCGKKFGKGESMRKHTKLACLRYSYTYKSHKKAKIS